MMPDATTHSRKRLGLVLRLAGMVGAGSLLPVLPSILSNLTGEARPGNGQRSVLLPHEIRKFRRYPSAYPG